MAVTQPMVNKKKLREGVCVCVVALVAVLQVELGGGFKYLLFSPPFGEDSHFD